MLESLRQVNLLQMVKWADHEARVLASELIRCLAHVDGLKLILLPESEQFLSHTERCSDIVHWHWSSFGQFLQNRFHVFLGL